MKSTFRYLSAGGLTGLAVSCVPASALPPATQPVHDGSRMIAGDHLAVEIMDPNDPHRYNRGVRFASVAAVVRVNCDGHEFLFHRAQPDPLTDVAGLFAEFDLKTPPPGFAEAALNEPFVKIGVGALRKTEADYRFFTSYPVDRLAETRVRWAPDAAEFEQTLSPVNGYGYVLSSRVSVSWRTLTIDWTLANTGTKAFATNQYLHNSFVFDGLPIGPGYVVSFPFDYAARGLKAQQGQDGRNIVFRAVMTKPVNIDVDYPEGYRGANAVTVRHVSADMQVDCETSLPGQRVAVHAAATYVCPEQFVAIPLQPGQRQQWTRRYVFGVGAVPGDKKSGK